MAIADNKGFMQKDIEALVANMNINMFRGSDSTGLVRISRNGDFNFLKIVGGPGELCNTNKWGPFRKSFVDHGKLAFGHGRAATRGKVTTKNAHPFEVFIDPSHHEKGHIVLCHNGTLHSYQQLPGFHEHDVDSEWMARKVLELGPKEALGKIYGAVATVFYDPVKKTLFFYRNSERPLHYVFTKEGNLLFNSTRAALMWLKYQCDLNFEADDVKEFETLKLYSVKTEIDKIEFDAVEEVPRIYPTYIPPVTYQGRSRAYSGSLEYDDDDTTVLFNKYQRNKWDREAEPRGFEEDAKAIFQRKYDFVAFEDGKRTTARSAYGSSWSSIEMIPPYVPGLRRLEMDEATKQIKATYDDNRTVLFLPKIDPKPRENIAINIAAPVEDKLYKGGNFRFVTELYGERHKHQVKLDDQSVYSMMSYWNDVDGRIKVGDMIELDVLDTDVEDLGFGSYRVTGFRTKEKMDAFIEFYFYSKPPKPLDGKYKGSISLISFTDKSEFEISRCYVKVLLKDVVKSDEEVVVVHEGESKVIMLAPTNEDTIY
jgi:hypothetical protein